MCFINLPNDVGSDKYVRFFHDRWNIPAYVISHENLENINVLERAPRKHSDSEGYVVFITGEQQFLSFLRLVKKTNPLARCLITYPIATVEQVADLHKLVWRFFHLVNVVIVTPTSEQHWSLFNPFEMEYHNLATLHNSRGYLRKMQNFQNLRGYPILVMLRMLLGKLIFEL